MAPDAAAQETGEAPSKPTNTKSTATSSDESTDTSSTSTESVTVSVVGPPLYVLPSQTVTSALTTIFTPPASCQGRYYVESSSESEFFSWWGITSGINDRLYWSCQPDPSAYDLYYSPGACPYPMAIAGVLSTTPNGSDPVTYTDVCCQRHVWPRSRKMECPAWYCPGTNKWRAFLFHSGFIWDLHSCFSVVRTSTRVLIAPAVATIDLFIPVSQVQARHDPIKVAWQTADLPLFPPDVREQKSSIAEHGWEMNSTTPAMSTPSEGTRPPPPGQTNHSTRVSLSTGAIVGIVIAALVCIAIFIVLSCFYRRRRRRQGRANKLGTVYTGARKSWLGNAWRVELNTQAATNQVQDDEANQPEHHADPRTTGNRQCEISPVELDSGSVLNPVDGNFERPGHESESIMVSSISDRIAPFNPVP
ncbi:hypothetical protein F4861DRAFT_133053 [Xylaria intraflava]|nr:hypothetical protein F4861DRAFT_133053 [Xylaria intraflava]